MSRVQHRLAWVCRLDTGAAGVDSPRLLGRSVVAPFCRGDLVDPLLVCMARLARKLVGHHPGDGPGLRLPEARLGLAPTSEQ